MTDTLIILFLIIWIHWFSDFVLQSDYIAKNKSKSNKILLRHIIIYSLPFFLIAHAIPNGFIWLTVNSILHFAIDWHTSRITSRLWKQGRVHDFFVVIGLDQALHMTCLFATYYLIVINEYGWI